MQQLSGARGEFVVRDGKVSSEFILRREKQLEEHHVVRRFAHDQVSGLLESDFEAANERFYDRKSFRFLQPFELLPLGVCAKMAAVYQF